MVRHVAVIKLFREPVGDHDADCHRTAACAPAPLKGRLGDWTLRAARPDMIWCARDSAWPAVLHGLFCAGPTVPAQWSARALAAI